jgi:hypothetical protein
LKLKPVFSETPDDAFAVGKKFPIALSLLASADSISS